MIDLQAEENRSADETAKQLTQFVVNGRNA